MSRVIREMIRNDNDLYAIDEERDAEMKSLDSVGPAFARPDTLFIHSENPMDLFPLRFLKS